MMSDTYNTEQLTPGSLLDHFLIAMPCQLDPDFAHSLLYICEHNSDGAMGLIVNQPLNLPLSSIYQQLGLEPTADDERMALCGGPVGIERGFVLHSTSKRRWENTLKISSQVSLTTSQDILIDMAGGDGPANSAVVLGYAGWEGGQLEDEIAKNSWLTVPACADIIFRTPVEKRTQAAAARLGLDMRLLCNSIGHA